MKNLWKFLVAAAMVIAIRIPAEEVKAADFDPSAATETYDCGGVTAYWYQSTGRMVFSGSGYVQNYVYDVLDKEWDSPPPYLSHMEEILTADFYGCFPGEYCLMGASGLSSVSLPSGTGCEEIRNYAFSGCSSLPSVSIPSGVKTIQLAAFEKCSSIEKIVIPSGVTRIYGYAFEDCSFMKTISIPETVTEIGQSAFYRCSSLTELNLPAGLTVIPSYFAYQCKALKTVVIPGSVQEIKMSAFYECSGLTKITIPDNVTALGGYAFSGCTNLSEITIGGGLSSMGAHAFFLAVSTPKKTRLLTTNTVALGYDWTGDNRQLSKDGDTVWQDDYTYTLDETNRTITLKAYNGSDTKIIIPEEAVISGKTYRVTALFGEYSRATFYKNEMITEVELPDTITEIPRSCFYGCTALTNIRFPLHLTEIGANAFYNCDALTSLTIGEELTTVGNYAFYVSYRSPRLDTLVRSESPGLYTYIWSSSNRNPVYPQNLLGIDELSDYTYEANAADHSIHLKSYSGSATDLVIPGIVSKDGVTWTVTEICTGCCKNNKTIEKVTIPDTVTKLGSDCFAYCSNLDTITGGNNVASVGGSAFAYFLYENNECKYKATVLETTSEALTGYNWSGSYRGIFTTTTDPDTTWQNDYEWYVDARTSTMRLSKYIGTGTEVRVPARAVVDSVIYPVGINGSTYKETGITSFSLENGVLLASLYSLFQNCGSLETIDFTGARPLSSGISISYAFSGCGVLNEVNFTGIDMSSVYPSTIGVFTGCQRLSRIVMPVGINSSCTIPLPGTFYEVQGDGSFGETEYSNLAAAPVGSVIGRTVSYFTVRLPVSVELSGENGFLSGDIPVIADTSIASGKSLVFRLYSGSQVPGYDLIWFSEIAPRQLEWTGVSENSEQKIHMETEQLAPGEYRNGLVFQISVE